ncbi:hypothetical protein [Pseudonocardia acidicola]|uniref:Uncharacterized protein n=1 Tax=Pseudonocardia acidicola TaxID=2724939 RepID=A0ABX1S7B2_9PSEU|nr:hypothetical protein [Pseudonocardia acidicola]NMH96782.1 hypothetical protein [Pseudonocardia acidicola]
MADELRRGHHHSGSDERPFWTRARIDHRGLNTISILAYAVAQRWVPEQAARRFSSATNAAAATVVEAGAATLDMWEEPGRLVCQIVRGAGDPGSGPHRRGSASAGGFCEHEPACCSASVCDITVYQDRDEAIVRMAV